MAYNGEICLVVEVLPKFQLPPDNTNNPTGCATPKVQPTFVPPFWAVKAVPDSKDSNMVLKVETKKINDKQDVNIVVLSNSKAVTPFEELIMSEATKKKFGDASRYRSLAPSKRSNDLAAYFVDKKQKS